MSAVPLKSAAKKRSIVPRAHKYKRWLVDLRQDAKLLGTKGDAGDPQRRKLPQCSTRVRASRKIGINHSLGILNENSPGGCQRNGLARTVDYLKTKFFLHKSNVAADA